MIKFFCKATVILLLLTLLFVTACWFYAEPILNNLARPQLEKFATQALSAEVQIGQLGWTETGLEMLALHIDSPGKLTASVPRLELNFTLSSIWNRQLLALNISNPRLELSQPADGEPSTKNVFKAPEQLPLTIEKLQVTGGELLLHAADRRWQLRQINFSTALQQTTPFKLEARFGADERFPLAANGTLEISQQTLTLDSFFWQGQQLLAAPLQAKLAGTDVSLGRSALRLKHFDHHQLQDLLNAFGLSPQLFENLKLSLTDSSIALALAGQDLQLELQIASGSVGWKNLNGRFNELKLLLSREQDGWSIAGQLQGPAKSTLAFNSRLTDTMLLSGQARSEIPDLALLNTELFAGTPLRISGGLQLTAAYTLQDNQLQLTTDIQGSAAKRESTDYLLNISQLSGQGTLQLTGNKEDFSLELLLAAQPFIRAVGNFQQLDISLTLLELQGLEKLLAPGQLPEQLQAASGLKVVGQFTNKVATWVGNLQLTADKINLPGLDIQGLDCRGNLQLTTNQLDFQQSKCGFGLTHDAGLSAQVTAQLTGEATSQQFSLTFKHLSLAQINYSSLDGQYGVGDATMTMQGDISGNLPHGPTALTLRGTLRVQELLAGTFYADLSAYSANFSLSGELQPAELQLHTQTLAIELPEIGSLTTTGLFSPTQIQLQSQLKLQNLASSYGEQLRPLLSGYRPAFADLNLGGEISLASVLHWSPQGWRTQGELQLRGLSADWKSQRLTVADGTGSIPFALGSPVALSAEVHTTAAAGEVSFAALSVSLANLEQGSLRLVAALNRLSFISPLQLQLAGGQVQIENLSLGWPAGTPQGSAKIKITEVELETLTKQLDLPIMQGRFSADLGTIHYAEQQLNSDGLASIEVFGGRFQLQNMRYSKPFSSYPTFYTDIDFSGVDLLQATRTFDFGEMNGVLDGHIHRLEIFGTTPAAFAAEFATRNEGKRNISVKALNNLSILSQGGLSAALSQGVYKFIDFYRYRMIGIKCSLENDTFTLLGTAAPGSNRYLVQGGLLPPRIDITTSTPTISFKEMVNRLGRIQRTGKSKSQGGKK